MFALSRALCRRITRVQKLPGMGICSTSGRLLQPVLEQPDCPHLVSNRFFVKYGLLDEFPGRMWDRRWQCAHPSAVCWQCSERVGMMDFFCGNCGKVQPANKNLTLFQVLGMESADFDVDLGQLEKVFKSGQMKLHPDRFASKLEQEKEYSSQQSTLFNRAYKTLRKPLTRAKYLLELQGIHETEGTIEDEEFLMQTMEWQEQVAETSDTKILTQLRNENLEFQDKVIKLLSEAFGKNDLETAGQLVIELTYLDRIEENILVKL